jgi:hypothetical protein
MPKKRRATNLNQTFHRNRCILITGVSTFRRFQRAHTVAEPVPAAFPHRRNKDGTFNSICPVCFRTVATRLLEYQLATKERNHVCKDAEDWSDIELEQSDPQKE